MSLMLSGGAGLDPASATSMIEFHSPRTALVIAPVLFGARNVLWLVSSMAVASIAAAGLIPVDKVVTAQGRIVALQPTTVIQPLEVAIVRSIDVHEGDNVHKGQVLAWLDPTFCHTADLGALASQVASLQAEVDRLQAEATGGES